MRNFIYELVKSYVKTGLHSYHKKIEVFGLENIPKDNPVLFLPNHQSALLDVLLIAVDCNRKPYFLTRADVFGKPILNRIFNFFQMIPVYRIRDGRSSLSKNEEVFDTCSKILGQGKSLVMFPEANHNLKRRVRPLSKGFTRIVFRALQQNKGLDLQIVPVGLNYQDAERFPDSVSIYYGKPIVAKSFYDEYDIPASEKRTKKEVSRSLKELTTHIASEEDYEDVVKVLKSRNVSFLRPKLVNEVLSSLDIKANQLEVGNNDLKGISPIKYLIAFLNLPVWLIWKYVIKPKVWEPEFKGTLRFATALIGSTLYFLILFLMVTILVNVQVATVIVISIFLLNRLLVKLA